MLRPMVTGVVAALTWALLAIPAAGQEEPNKAAVEQALARWLATDQTDEALLGRTVDTILSGGDRGLGVLADALAAHDAPSDPRRKGVRSLASHVCLVFLRRQIATDMVYAGQFAPLSRLGPFAQRFFMGLLLETPDWYPSTHRKQVVPVLRDLLPRPPDGPTLDAIAAVAADTEGEPEDLRRMLGYALHQWGRPQLAEAELDRWRRQSAEGDAEDRVMALRQLAEVHYQLRDYKAAAGAHAALMALAESSQTDLWPTDLYSAACCWALAGDPERAFQALQQCADLQASGRVDPSLHIARRVFENDPELRALRGQERWHQVMAALQGGRDGGGKARDR